MTPKVIVKKATAPVVVGTDFSKKCALATQRAARVAVDSGAPLFLVHVVSTVGPTAAVPMMEPWLGKQATTVGSHEESVKTIQKTSERMLERLELPAGVKVHRLTRAGDPREVLLEVARNNKARVIVVGSHAPAGVLKTYFLGSTADRLLRTGTCPILLAKKKGGGYKKILVAVDFSPMSVEVVRTAHELFPNAKFVLGTVVPLPRGEKLTKTRAVELEISLRALAGEAGLDGDDIEVSVSTGDPRHGILALGVARQPDLIAIGTHARTGVARFLIGSVAEFVTRMSPVDVLAVPPGN